MFCVHVCAGLSQLEMFPMGNLGQFPEESHLSLVSQMASERERERERERETERQRDREREDVYMMGTQPCLSVVPHFLN